MDTIFWFGYQTDVLKLNSKTAIKDYIQDQTILDKRCLINPQKYAIVPNQVLVESVIQAPKMYSLIENLITIDFSAEVT